MSDRAAGSWEFWIDVGGTFTDCIARGPDGTIRTFKTLSSGRTKGTVQTHDHDVIVDPARVRDPDGFWLGYRLDLIRDGQVVHRATVSRSEASEGLLKLNPHFPEDAVGLSYELYSGESSPILAIRYLMKLGRNEPIPPVHLRFGTTRGTNALLTRTGARTALVTTAGFGDVLLIGNQDRPELFRLDIEKPEPLFETVLEVDERLDAAGDVVHSLDEQSLRNGLMRLRTDGIESVAVCLLHAWKNSSHEQRVAAIVRESGFSEISVSSQLSPVLKLVSRGDTTVLDAYVNPVLRRYLSGIANTLAGSRVQLMTSAGGLVDAAMFSGKDSLLSGPAGGVVGFAQAAEAAGFPRAIGFDMGGTSTDVARYAGAFAIDYETTRAGIRIAAPTMAIETVAAGGGSICGFDGVRLHVGPASAGADPGPACYGGGGPLTITDLNVWLGRIVPEHFPFRLDRNIVERRLGELCDQVNAVHETRYSLTSLAEGLLQIANANMVRAIRRVSVARGYDPADHALVTFGGAGAQHACAIADSLGMKDILVHPMAGILSAWGIGHASLRAHKAQTVLTAYEDAARFDRIFERLEQQAVEDLLRQGARVEQLRTERSLDLRYRGLQATMNVRRPDDGDYAQAYADMHHREFGYTRKSGEIEVVTVRVEVIAESTHRDMDGPRESTEPVPVPMMVTPMVCGGESLDAVVYARSQLHVGHRLEGPTIVLDDTSTIVVDPGWTAIVTERGDLVLSRQETSATPHAEAAVDPVRLEVMNNQFASIAEQMGETLRRTSVSTNVKERLDFSCAVFDATGALVVNAPHIPVHLGAMSETVRCIIRDNPQIAPGDVFVTNDPFRGGSHLPDVTVVTPVHLPETGDLAFFTASRAHHAEIGGILPGSMPPFSTTLADEGVLIRNFRLIAGGVSQDDALRSLLSEAPLPSRAVEDNLSDINAQVAANRIGAAELTRLVASEGATVVADSMDQIQQAAARKVRLALAAMPDGEYAMTDCLDDGSPVAVSVAIEGDRARVDFSGTGPVLASNLNANRAIVSAAVLYVLRCLIDEDIPLNAGVLDPVEIVLPECLLNPPEHDDPARCAAMVGGNVETSQRVVDVLLGALQLAAASQGTMNNLTFGDESFGYYETICGGAGATAKQAGADAVHTHMTNTRLTDPEVIEHRYPVRVDEFRIRTDSAGRGRMRGGEGIVRKLTFLRALTVSMLSQRRTERPFGLAGGERGAVGVNEFVPRGSDRSEPLSGSFTRSVEPGDAIIIRTPGGGGYGSAR